MKIAIDVVVGKCSMSLQELLELNKGSNIKIDNFVQTQVQLKSGNELIATGTLIKVDEQYLVSVENINQSMLEVEY